MKNEFLGQLQTGEDSWCRVAIDLCTRYGNDVFNNWFRKIAFVEVTSSGILVLAAPSPFVRDWIVTHYSEALTNAYRMYDTSVSSLEVLIDPKKIQLDSAKLSESIPISTSDSVERGELSNFLDPRSTFENFVVGQSNELAYAAALSIAEAKDVNMKSNPLFLYGGVGLGKTHLMHAIAWHVRKHNPERRVLYLSAERFMYRFIKALRSKDVMSFKEEFRSVDILMIDDIQFLCGKEGTQEEFFHTFNTINGSNKQMVVSCDRSPSDLENVEDRIKSRLGWGLVVDVHSTTYELRLGILQSKIEQMKVAIPEEVVDLLAAKITSNIRELEGALNKVVAHAAFIGKEITLANSKLILADLLRCNERVVTIDDIQRKVSERYNIKRADMFSVSRTRTVARPRQIAMYLAKYLTSKSLQVIGAKFGNKDHTTVMHAVKKVEELMKEDSEFGSEVQSLIRVLQS